MKFEDKISNSFWKWKIVNNAFDASLRFGFSPPTPSAVSSEREHGSREAVDANHLDCHDSLSQLTTASETVVIISCP